MARAAFEFVEDDPLQGRECAMRIRRALERVCGVEGITIDVRKQRISITYNPILLDGDWLGEKMADLGHVVRPAFRAGSAASPRTIIFFLRDDGSIREISPHAYARLVRGEVRMPELALRRIRVADWYVGGRESTAEPLNETYSILYFDESGGASPVCQPGLIRENKSLHVTLDADPYAAACERPADKTWHPTADERRALLGLLSDNQCSSRPRSA
ncbi:MAG TPA: hypothetical protein VG873_10480 [Burkholderiales bacterium]|nr:hypothetical protein [Burkholderiales bacterium]